MNNEPITSVVLCVRSWFDKHYGNSYYTMRVIVNGHSLITGMMRYGHSHSMYWETAKQMMREAHYEVDEMTASLAVFDVCEVSRRKDLHGGGRAVKA